MTEIRSICNISKPTGGVIERSKNWSSCHRTYLFLYLCKYHLHVLMFSHHFCYHNKHFDRVHELSGDCEFEKIFFDLFGLFEILRDQEPYIFDFWKTPVILLYNHKTYNDFPSIFQDLWSYFLKITTQIVWPKILNIIRWYLKL